MPFARISCSSPINPIPGEVYNIGGTYTCTVGDMLQTLLSFATVPDIRVEPDPDRMRPIDADLQVPDTAKFRAHTGWAPEIPFEQTMHDLLEYWRRSCGQGRAVPSAVNGTWSLSPAAPAWPAAPSSRRCSGGVRPAVCARRIEPRLRRSSTSAWSTCRSTCRTHRRSRSALARVRRGRARGLRERRHRDAVARAVAPGQAEPRARRDLAGGAARRRRPARGVRRLGDLLPALRRRHPRGSARLEPGSQPRSVRRRLGDADRRRSSASSGVARRAWTS